jgi:two-component system response regulator PilR (NtrC family)
LFLDEVADLPLAMQVKLLRTIQEKQVRKVGATNEDSVDVRMICATHQNLTALVEAGKFRQDLYFRLNVIELKMPSLKECREDIPALAQAMLERLSGAAGAAPRLSGAAQAALAGYDFPGNVRELENILERAVALCGGKEILASDLRLTPARQTGDAPSGEKWPLQDYLDRVEREAILEALGMTRFNRTAAAKLLGITFRALRYRMERLGINEPRA